MSTTQELVERLQNVSEWKQIIERHRRITDDPAISYVLKDGTRVHEDENVIAKLAASLSRALEDTADISKAAAARLSELERENARMREALRALVQSCTTGIEVNGRHYSARTPSPMVVNAARTALAESTLAISSLDS